MVFKIPIAELEDVQPTKDKGEIRRLFTIAVWRNNVYIELTDEEYGFFFRMIVKFAVDFYHLPQTRDSQDLTARLQLPAFGFGALTPTTIGMTSNGS